jgi:cyclohexa-1,5-dienecarbonyl-CoA hydratase
MNEKKAIGELRHSGAVLHITLNAPKANVLDSEMLGEIESLLENTTGPGVKAIVFEGAGKHFSFGASVEEHQADRVADMLDQFHGLFYRLRELAIPTFAIVRGQCLGGGLELAGYCSWIFADDSAQFGQPEIRLAVFPPMASILLPWRLGGARALDLCVSGRSVKADEAMSMGLVHSVTSDPAADCDTYIAENLLPLSASSMRMAERAARTALFAALENDLPQVEKLYLEELMKTPDANEGIAAFLEKRPPRYGAAQS